jgi:putative hydrolase of the HAD superfamily
MARYLIWDFDGTLAYHDLMWSGALLEALNTSGLDVANTVTREAVKPHLQSGFRWHEPLERYDIKSPDNWWLELEPLFETAYKASGIPEEQANIIAKMVRGIYVDPANWRIYDDVIPTLTQLSSDGWKHLILSNHVPELSIIADHLGLTAHIEQIFKSAETGFEKPHPMAYERVLEYIGHSPKPQAVWMIGDSIAADIHGAEAAGIPAILVRKCEQNVAYWTNDFTGIAGILSQQSS